MTNNVKYYIRNALYATSLFLVSGSIVQTYLHEAGLSPEQIGFYVSMASVAGLVVSGLLGRMADRSGRIKQHLLRYTLMAAGCSLLFIPFCFYRGPAFLPLVFLLGAAQSLVFGFKNLYEYKLPYYIVQVETIGSMYSVDGVITGLVGIVPGLMLSFFLKRSSFFPVMAGAFLTAALLMAGAAGVTGSFRMRPPRNAPSASSVGEKLTAAQILRYPLFLELLPANLLRGAIYGTVSIAAVIGLHEVGFDSSAAAIIPITATAANIAGSLLYMLLSRWMKGCTLVLVAGLMTAVYPLSCLGGIPLFVLCFFITSLGTMFLNCSVPYIVYQVVPYEIGGVYNNWRMTVTNLVTALTAAACGKLIGRVPAWTFLAAASLCQLLSSLLYYRFSLKHIKEK